MERVRVRDLLRERERRQLGLPGSVVPEGGEGGDEGGRGEDGTETTDWTDIGGADEAKKGTTRNTKPRQPTSFEPSNIHTGGSPRVSPWVCPGYTKGSLVVQGIPPRLPQGIP